MKRENWSCGVVADPKIDGVVAGAGGGQAELTGVSPEQSALIAWHCSIRCQYYQTLTGSAGELVLLVAHTCQPPN